MHFYQILLVFSLISLATLAVIFWRKKDVPGARPFSMLMIALTIWSCGYYFEIQSVSFQEFTFWAKFEYFGIVLIPASWLVFVFRFTGKERHVNRRNLLLLFIAPTAMLIITWSNKLNHLLWRSVQFEPGKPLSLGIYDHGLAFWINTAYTYAILLIGSFFLIQYLHKYQQGYRGQLFVLLVGMLAPLVGNLLYLIRFNPLPNFDLTLLGFIVTGLATSLALLRYRFLEILPIAHSALIKNMSDGLLVLDEQERIAEINPAALKIFNISLTNSLTLPFSHGLADFPEFVDKVQNIRDGKAEIALIDARSGNQRIFEMQISPLDKQTNPASGKMVVLREITERVETMEGLKRREAILVAIRFAASELMKGTDWQKVIPDVLEQLGRVVKASRAYIFMNHRDANGELLTTKLFEWTAAGIQSQLNNPELKDLPVAKAGYDRWQQFMSQGKPVFGIIEQFPPDERPLLERLGIQSLIITPIFVGEDFWGFIGFDDCLKKRTWSNAEIDALKAAASTFGSSIQRQMMEEQLLERLEILDSLYQTSLEIAAPHDLPTLLRTIVARAVKLINGTSGSLYLRNAEGEDLTCMVSYQAKKDITGYVLHVGEGAAGKVAQTKKALIVEDYRTWEGRAPQFEIDQPFVSVISAPMTWQDQVLGVLHVTHESLPNHFSAKDLTLLSLFANQAAIGLQSAQSMQIMQVRARRLAIINGITRISLESEEQEHLLEQLTDRLGELMNADSCFIELWDKQKKQVIPKAAFGPYKGIFEQFIFSPGETSMTKAVMESGQTMVVEDYQNSSLVNRRLAHQLTKICSMIALPLTAGEHHLGAALIGFHQPHKFDAEEIELCEQAAAQVALAMDKTRLIEAAQQRAEVLDALRANVTGLSGELDNQVLLKAILERAATLLNATGGDLGLLDPTDGDICILVSYNLGKDYVGTRMAIGEGAMGLAVAIDDIVVIEDYAEWDGRSPQYLSGNWHAVMATPLRIGGRILGALGIVDLHPERTFSAEDQELLNLFAQQASIAIENARLFNIQKQRALELGILYESSTLITKSLDLKTVFRISAEQLCRAVDSTSAYISTCDLENGSICPQAEYFSPEASPLERTPDLNLPRSLFDYPRSIEYLRQGKPQVMHVTDLDIDEKDRAELITHGVKSALEVPMIISGRVLGFIDIWECREERIWSEEEIRVCQTLSNQAAIAIENARLYSEILQLAVTDMLTGIYNRRGLFEAGQRELNRTRRSKRPLSAIMLDIDHFKEVNDAYSHTIGDQVLKELVKICRKNLREIDIIGRYGGEEFVVLLPETHFPRAQQIAERLRLHIAKRPLQTDAGPIAITVSMGIACTTDGKLELATLLDRTDSAMYSAKHKGRNRVASIQPTYELQI